MTYNKLFQLHELAVAIKSNRNTSPGMNQIHNLMIKHLPENEKKHLLYIYNIIWNSDYFPPEWRQAAINPIHKPGEDASNVYNYRPISRTSCLCKTLEKMINRRLMETLEKNKTLSQIQCGFRKNHSTLDHLVRFDTYVRRNLVSDRYVRAMFFDLQKA